MKQLDEHAHKASVFHAINCAEQVLTHFERARPDDPRPRQALAAGRAWLRGELSVSRVRVAAFAAHAAARDTELPAARAAARSAGHAAATVHVITHGPHAATYARKAATSVASA